MGKRASGPVHYRASPARISRKVAPEPGAPLGNPDFRSSQPTDLNRRHCVFHPENYDQKRRTNAFCKNGGYHGANRSAGISQSARQKSLHLAAGKGTYGKRPSLGSRWSAKNSLRGSGRNNLSHF